MCGLTGFLNRRCDQPLGEQEQIVGRMAAALHHRGPDDTGLWCDPTTGIALGFKRLSIIDLSPAGHQPMKSSCGRFVIAFNGEIYNAPALRSELVREGRPFRGHSDTEVLAEGFATWGIVPTLKRCVGMFAIAAWETQRRELTLIRDRLGKKPLYFGKASGGQGDGTSGSTLLFGSETKALRQHPAFRPEISRRMLGEFLSHSYVPHGSIYEGIHQVRPGCLTTISLDDDSFWSPHGQARQVEYWQIDKVVDVGMIHPFTGTFEQATDELEMLLTDAVGCRMMADVPLGAFLSGGIDSSLIVSLMQQQSSRPIRTFTIGFEEEAYNEAPFAKRVASHLGTDHTELYVTAQQARDVIPLLPTIFDEPFADSSQIPTYLVSQLARQHVTVALSGDGGDELFCGYRRYFEALAGFQVPGREDVFGPASQPPGSLGTTTVPTSGRGRLIERLRSLPSVVRGPMGVLASGLSHLPLGRTSHLFRQLATVLNEQSPDDRYLRNLRHWHAADQVVVGLAQRDERVVWNDQWPAVKNRTASDFQQVWQWYDQWHYLPGDILTKVDRASMAVSLEARVPLLDHRVVEFAWRLPHAYRVANGSGKRILRAILARHVPSKLFERPKVGFGVPIDAWLRGPLRDWAEDLLDENRLRREGFLNATPIRRKWADHLSGRADGHYPLWDVLMFQAWLAHWQNNGTV